MQYTSDSSKFSGYTASFFKDVRRKRESFPESERRFSTDPPVTTTDSTTIKKFALIKLKLMYILLMNCIHIIKWNNLWLFKLFRFSAFILFCLLRNITDVESLVCNFRCFFLIVFHSICPSDALHSAKLIYIVHIYIFRFIS